MSTVLDVAPALGVLATCAAFGVARASYYRKRAPADGHDAGLELSEATTDLYLIQPNGTRVHLFLRRVVRGWELTETGRVQVWADFGAGDIGDSLGTGRYTRVSNLACAPPRLGSRPRWDDRCA